MDNVDCDAASERGVVVMNTPTGNTTTTAELALALLFAIARHTARADRTVRGGTWKKKGLVGTELTGKTLGVIGLGRIGRVVADRGVGLRMNVLAHDPYLQGRECPVAGASLVELDELLARSDFVTLHVPLTDSTRDLLSAERIATMKPGAHLINAARGGLVDEAAVAAALDEGRLAGAAFDVLSEEPPGPGHPLRDRDDVILTPHLGASSAEAQLAVARDVALQISDFLVDGVARNAVNAPALPAEAMAELAPYLKLAEALGSFLAQVLTDPVRKLELTVSGAIAEHDTEHLALAVLVGVLRHAQPTGVNFVNARLLARERDLRILVETTDESYFRLGQIKVRASSKGGSESHLVAGTMFGVEPRLVRIDGVHLDLRPQGTLLLTHHRDAPGVLGELGTILGRHSVNIRRVELGPEGDNGNDLARAFLSLDKQPAPGVLAEISAMDSMQSVRVVHLGPPDEAR